MKYEKMNAPQQQQRKVPVVYRPPAVMQPAARVVVMGGGKKWRAAWIAGLVCALLPLLAVGTVVVLASMHPAELKGVHAGALGVVVAGAMMILLCSLLLDGVAVICAIAAIILGAPARGLLVLFLTLPVFAVFALVKLRETPPEQPQLQWFYYSEERRLEG